MSSTNPFHYDGKRVLVVGGATGMGAAAAKAAAQLGAEVIAMDLAPIEYDVAQAMTVDLSERSSIDAALDEIKGPIHAVYSAAGVADGPKLMRINFIGHRHLIETLMARGQLGRGSAICFISSTAGMGWEADLPRLLDFLATPDYESADAWIAAREADYINNYGFAKQAINAYVARQAYPLLKRGIRINSILPGPTDTPLGQANADVWLAFAQDYRDATGTAHHTPEQMGNAMAFLCSDAASGISGTMLLVDAGHTMASLSGSFEPGKQIVEFLLGRHLTQ